MRSIWQIAVHPPALSRKHFPAKSLRLSPPMIGPVRLYLQHLICKFYLESDSKCTCRPRVCLPWYALDLHSTPRCHNGSVNARLTSPIRSIGSSTLMYSQHILALHDTRLAYRDLLVFSLERVCIMLYARSDIEQLGSTNMMNHVHLLLEIRCCIMHLHLPFTLTSHLISTHTLPVLFMSLSIAYYNNIDEAASILYHAYRYSGPGLFRGLSFLCSLPCGCYYTPTLQLLFFSCLLSPYHMLTTRRKYHDCEAGVPTIARDSLAALSLPSLLSVWVNQAQHILRSFHVSLLEMNDMRQLCLQKLHHMTIKLDFACVQIFAWIESLGRVCTAYVICSTQVRLSGWLTMTSATPFG
jgi:hypothetical protein